MRSKGGILFLALIGFAALILVYYNHFDNPFELDDSHTIVNNQAIRELNVGEFFKDPRTFSSLPANQAYRPGVTTLNAIDYVIWSEGPQDAPEPKWFHVSIFVTFIILCVALFFFYRKFFSYAFPGREWNDHFALLTAAFFAFHTANAETVNYIIARSDLYSTLFVILAFFLFFSPALRKFHVFLIPVVIGFFIKEPTIMFAPLAFMFVFFFEENGSVSARDIFSAKIIKPLLYSAIAFVTGIGLIVFAKSMTLPTWTSGAGDVNPLKYFITNFYSVLHYIFNFILPANLAVDTDIKTFERYFDVRAMAGFVLIVVLLVLAVKWSMKKETRPAAFGVFWFFVTLIPTSTFFPFAEPLNDHRTFFGYAGLVLTVTTLLANYVYSRQFKTSLTFFWLMCVILIGAYGFGVIKRNEVWGSEESLWADAARKCPNSGRIWMNYGLAQMKTGKYQEAYSNFLKAKDEWPDYPYVYINLGIVKNVLGMKDDAENDFRTALTKGPEIPGAYKYYADFLLQQGRVAEADSLAQQGLSISPYSADLLELKSSVEKAKASVGQQQITVPAMLEAVKLNPSVDNWLNLSLAFYNAGDFRACIDAANQVLKINPDSDLAYNNICAAYNMLKEWDKAIEAGQKGLKINPDNVLLANNLKVALEGKKKNP